MFGLGHYGLLPKAVNPENAKSRFFTSFRMTTKNNALRCRPERSEGSLASNLWRKAFEQQPDYYHPRMI
jgi:hypothetical protein